MFKEVKHLHSSDSNVIKLIFEKDDAIAESVLYRYGSFQERTVICCSVQSGCPVGCTFCGTGKKFIRNLSAKEIVYQVKEAVKLAEETEDFKNLNSRCGKFQIMFMSMGEPFLNYNESVIALYDLNAMYPNAQLLVSTIGVNKPLDMLEFLSISKDINKIGLQFSIHEAIDAERDILIPYKNKLNLRQIRDYGIKWNKETGRPVYLNYCVTERNSDCYSLNRLKDLFSPETFHFTFSVVCEADENLKGKSYKMHDRINDVMASFIEDGYNVRKFDPAGQDDIGGGCGQLWYVQDWMKSHKK